MRKIANIQQVKRVTQFNASIKERLRAGEQLLKMMREEYIQRIKREIMEMKKGAHEEEPSSEESVPLEKKDIDNVDFDDDSITMLDKEDLDKSIAIRQLKKSVLEDRNQKREKDSLSEENKNLN